MKKNLYLLIALVITALLFVGISIAVNRPGDVNGDGEADNKDVVSLFRAVSTGVFPEVTETEDAASEEASVTEERTEPEETAIETEEEKENDRNITPEEGSVVSLLNDVMTDWVTNYKRGKLDKVFDYTERCEPVPVHFSWDEKADYTHLLLSKSADMSDPDVYLCVGSELDVEDLLPGTEYYWQTVSNNGGVNSRSAVHSFKTLQTIRTMYIPGVSNVRDLGGKITSDGKRIKYGIVYRGADFAHITKEGISKAVDILGIKTELDLREKVNNGRSTLGKKINYISVTAPYYEKIQQDEYKEALLTELRAFADSDNYPIYFHCSLGRDRTGTLAFILQALLGVEDDDLYIDYEASFFSDMGGYVDNAPPSTTLANLNILKSILSPKGKQLQNDTISYLKALGMTDAELDAIRANMLEDGQ